MAQLALTLLGPLQAMLDGVPIAGFESQKVRGLLVYLALEADRPHGRDALAGLLWPDQADQAARTNLRQALSNLGQAIGNQRATPPFVQVTGATIQFNRASEQQVDVVSFADLLTACEGHQHRHPETCTSCARRMEQAVDQYRGEFLAGFFLADSAAFEEWALLKREQLHRRAITALGQLAAYHERRGEYAPAQHYTQRQLELDPWREESHRQLMRVLALSGQRSAALMQYATCRRILDAELGVAPETETTALCAQIKRGDVVPTIHSVPTNNLAAHTPPTALIGRETELAQLADRLEQRDCRLLTLVGPGGIGKTRLALQAAADVGASFRDGVAFVPLASISAAEFLVPAIAGALGFTFQGQVDPHVQLLGFLRTKDILLVLDNFEQVRDGAAVLSALLQSALRVVFLVTSREPLSLRVEWLIDVLGLAVPARADARNVEQSSAVQLFVQIARRTQSDFALSAEQTPSVVRICQLVAGTPLAIELAAAWVRSQSCVDIARALEASLEVLGTTMQDVNIRHRSMRAVFDHSWHLLSPHEQDALSKLSIFRTGMLEDAAGQVAGATPLILAALINKSLLRRNGVGRYDLHELVRQYADEQLRAAGTLERTQTQHATYYLTLAEATEPALRQEAQQQWLNLLEVEHDNLRAALAWAIASREAAVALGLAGALQRFWWVRGHLNEGRRWLGAALTLVEGDGLTSVHTKVLNGAGILATLQGDFAAGRGLHAEALRIGTAIDDGTGIASALLGLGTVAQFQRDYVQATTFLEEGLALDGELAGWCKGWMLFHLGVVAQAQGAYTRATARLEASLALFRAVQERVGIAEALRSLGFVVWRQGAYERAAALFEESLALCRELGDRRGIPWAIMELGWVAVQQGDNARAAGMFAESLVLLRELGDQRGIAECLEGCSAVAGVQGQAAWAARLRGAAEALRYAIGITLSSIEHTDLEHAIVTLRAQLGENAFAAAWAEGQALSLEQAIAEALQTAT